MLKVTCIVIGIAAVVGLGFVIDAESRPKPRESAATGPSESSQVHAPGRVEGATEEIDLRAQLFGQVDEVLVREGQTVEAGAPLMRLDGARQEYECAAAEADLAAAKADLERLTNGARDEERREAAAEVAALSAQLDGVRQRHGRMATLRKSGATTDQALDDLDTEINRLTAQLDAARARHELLEAPARDDELRRARAKVAAADARLKLARHECDKTTLRAPRSVEILRVNLHAGELSDPDSSEPALIVADTSKLYVRAYVDEFDVPHVRTGMNARVTADGLTGDVRGRVVRLAPRMTQKPLRTDDPLERFDTKVREVWIELEGAGTESLVVGLPVDVVLDLASPGAPEHERAVEEERGGDSKIQNPKSKIRS
ncbi:MAG TPA: HlyD family efflux transporter periplasmic adaptor subunit [Pirellulales bacterium]|nr:HlyD family efflux transporter periplasmic adaptor subunit [Pirellulales bacterium]